MRSKDVRWLHAEPVWPFLDWQFEVRVYALPGPSFREVCPSQRYVSLCSRFLSYSGFGFSEVFALRHAYRDKSLANWPYRDIPIPEMWLPV